MIRQPLSDVVPERAADVDAVDEHDRWAVADLAVGDVGALDGDLHAVSAWAGTKAAVSSPLIILAMSAESQ